MAPKGSSKSTLSLMYYQITQTRPHLLQQQKVFERGQITDEWLATLRQNNRKKKTVFNFTHSQSSTASTDCTKVSIVLFSVSNSFHMGTSAILGHFVFCDTA